MQKSLKPLYPYLWKYRYTLLFGALTVVLTNGIWVLFPQVVQRASDALNRGTTRRQLMIYCLLMVAIAAAKGIFQFLTRWLVIGVSREIEYDLRNDLFLHLESLSYSFYQKTRTGDIMARATKLTSSPTSTRSMFKERGWPIWSCAASVISSTVATMRLIAPWMGDMCVSSHARSRVRPLARLIWISWTRP